MYVQISEVRVKLTGEFVLIGEIRQNLSRCAIGRWELLFLGRRALFYMQKDKSLNNNNDNNNSNNNNNNNNNDNSRHL